MNDEGFHLKYQMICGGVFRGESGVIISPNYPNRYSHKSDCEYDIYAPEGKAIVLNMLDFGIEQNSMCTADYLEVIDFAKAENETKSDRFCGITKPEQSFVSRFNHLQVHFVTDDSVSGKGFAANYSFIDVGCGGIIMNETTISNQMKYKNRMFLRCQWVVIAPKGSVIKFSLRNFHFKNDEIACENFVTIFNNGSGSGQAGPFCESFESKVFTTTSNIATVVYHEDSDNDQDDFSFAVEFIESIKLCSANYFSAQGVIESPGKPVYMSSKICEWTITVPHGQQIELNFKYFDMEDSVNCVLDFLEIRNGGSK